MATVPFVMVMGLVLFLGIRWGGWNVGPVLVTFVFALFFASTGPGMEVLGWMVDLGNELFPQLARWSS
jgi:hypothetical protein